MMNELYPIALKLRGKHVVVIGGGHIGLRKTEGLIHTGALITVISKTFLPQFYKLEGLTLIEREYQVQDIKNAHLIYIATNDPTLNASITRDATEWQWVNDVSNPTLSNFYTPAVVRERGLIVGISTENSDPKKAKRYKERIKDYLSHHE